MLPTADQLNAMIDSVLETLRQSDHVTLAFDKRQRASHAGMPGLDRK